MAVKNGKSRAENVYENLFFTSPGGMATSFHLRGHVPDLGHGRPKTGCHATQEKRGSHTRSEWMLRLTKVGIITPY
jgi:hypothetical protein